MVKNYNYSKVCKSEIDVISGEEWDTILSRGDKIITMGIEGYGFFCLSDRSIIQNVLSRGMNNIAIYFEPINIYINRNIIELIEQGVDFFYVYLPRFPHMINNNPNKPIYEIVSLNKNILTDRTSIDDIRNLVFNTEEKYDESKAIESVMDVDDDIMDENGNVLSPVGSVGNIRNLNNEESEESDEDEILRHPPRLVRQQNIIEDDDDEILRHPPRLVRQQNIIEDDNLSVDENINNRNRRNRSVSSVRSELSKRSELSERTDTSNLSDRSEINRDPLVLAVKQQNTKIIQELLKNVKNINEYNLNYAFIEAIKKGNIEIAELLLKNGARVNAFDGKALIIAVKNNKTGLVKFLIDYNRNIPTRLQNAKINLNARNGQALRIATKNGNIDIVRLLVDNGANVRVENSEALILACKYKKNTIIQYLLLNGANPNANNGEPMFWAIYNNDNFTMIDLMGRGATMDYLTREQLNYLLNRLVFVIQGNKDIIEMLVDKGAVIEVNKDTLYKLIKKGNLTELKKLVRGGANIDFSDINLISIAIKNKKTNMIMYLLKQGAVYDRNDAKLLKYLLDDGDYQTTDIQFLYSRGFDFQNHLQLLIEKGYINTIKFLLRAGLILDKNDINIVNTALNKNRNLVKFLIREGFVFDNTDKRILEIALSSVDFFRLLLEKGFVIDKLNPIYVNTAIKRENLPMVKFLIDNGFSIDINNKNLLYNAINSNNYKLLKFLIMEKGFEINNITDMYKIDLLKIINYEDDVKFFDYMFNQLNLDFNIQYLSRIVFSQQQRKNKIIKYLIKKGYINIDTDYILNNYISNIHDKKLIKIIVDKYPNLANHNKKFNELLVENKNFNFIEYLVRNREKRANINLQDERLIKKAIQKRQLNFLLLLVEKGINFDTTDVDLERQLLGKTLNKDNLNFFKFLIERNNELITDDNNLRNIAKKVNNKILKYLLDNGIDMMRYENDLLRNALENDNLELFRFLQERNNNIINEETFTLAVGNEQYEIINYLLENGINVNANNNFALNIAIEGGDFTLIKILINHGADPTLLLDGVINNDNRTNIYNIYKFLLQSGAIVSQEMIENAIRKHRTQVAELLENYVNNGNVYIGERISNIVDFKDDIDLEEENNDSEIDEEDEEEHEENEDEEDDEVNNNDFEIDIDEEVNDDDLEI